MVYFSWITRGNFLKTALPTVLIHLMLCKGCPQGMNVRVSLASLELISKQTVSFIILSGFRISSTYLVNICLYALHKHSAVIFRKPDSQLEVKRFFHILKCWKIKTREIKLKNSKQCPLCSTWFLPIFIQSRCSRQDAHCSQRWGRRCTGLEYISVQLPHPVYT